jgi:predicted CoA-binding protein
LNTPNKRADLFYDAGRFAVLGMSKTKKNFAWSVYNGLVKAGLDVFPVHPEGGSSRGIEFFKTCAEIPGAPDAAVLCFDLTKSTDTLRALKESGIRKLWLQQGSFDKSHLKEAEELGLECYTGCAMMYMPETAFIHRFHRFLHELFTKGTD